MPPNFATLPAGTRITPEPFTIAIPETDLEELSTLLKLSRLSKKTYENTTTDTNFGVSRAWLENATRFWKEDFDWRKNEKHINSFPQYTTLVKAPGQEPTKIHFAALFSQKRDAVPILMLHGWPGSYLEFLPILSQLQKDFTPDTLPYHVIVPSLPGFAFSDPPPLNRNFDLDDVAVIFDKLMVDLGFGSGYVSQGGDLGSKISRILGGVKFDSCKAVHINYCFMTEPDNPIGEVTDIEREDLKKGAEFAKTGAGYALEQATRPSTLGLVLSSNPVALLAWVGEKFLDWSDEDPDLDIIIEAIALYWFTDTISSSFYNYRQSLTAYNAGGHANPNCYISVPFGFSSFAKEIALVPKAWAATTGDLVFYRRHDAGGHFAALEKPNVLLKDISDFVSQVWKV